MNTDEQHVRGAVFVTGGAPGVGKSRAGVSLAEAGATGFEWFGLTVHRKFKTLIIQNENGEFRLSKEFADLDCEKLDPWVRVCPPPPFGLCFDRVEFRAVLARAAKTMTANLVRVRRGSARTDCSLPSLALIGTSSTIRTKMSG